MGKAARWFRNILLGKKHDPNATKEKQDLPPPPKRWSFGKSSRDSAEAAAAASSHAAIARSAESERDEQSKHAIAVAAATAAVAAAQAAVAVVRLTSKGPVLGCGAGAGPRAAAAAVRIQTAFRGFLAKKALRALKALVKLQALVRGYLVRRQAAATLHSMQALVRAQAAVRAHRAVAAYSTLPPPLHRPRYSLQERCADDTRSEHGGGSRRLSASVESSSTYGGYDRSPKIVEVDPGQGRPTKSRSSSSRRASTLMLLDAGSSGEDWSANSISSPLPSCYHLAPGPPRIATSRHHHHHDNHHDCCALARDSVEKARPATAQSTPRYMYAPPTPAKSVANANGYSSPSLGACPGYMSSTQSSEAKQARSQSAPKQRPPDHLCCGARKRVPLSEVVVVEAARASLTGGVASVHRASCNARVAAHDAFSFKAAVVGRMDRTLEVAGVENDRMAFLQRRW